MFRRLLFMTFALGLFTTACTSAGLPSSYEEQDRRTEKQFVAACKGALDDGEPADYCQCAFYTIAANESFEDFLDADEALKNDPEGLENKFRVHLESVTSPCEYSADDVYTG